MAKIYWRNRVSLANKMKFTHQLRYYKSKSPQESHKLLGYYKMMD